ncbi:methyl-accepting chemotaxis protein [Kibdelosporangium banguiense]|uniref:histidine kinase n=1 Tax=Kibdelosporangium banguiense TaxID=1365924 RepID=A0ABS4TR74_9PSEU|nr:HAMP domain-containing protein [Kibdelosporangium banguiense]MBP2326910.1 methyl-accepting chemotaxis protein [Kibdelosporangium banguiense]
MSSQEFDRPPAEAGFPSGVRVPAIAVLTVLALLAVFCTFRLGGQPDASETRVVAPSQQWFADILARSVGESVNDAVGDLATAVKLYGSEPGRGPEHAIEYFARTSSHTRGLAVLDRPSGRLLAAAGEPVAIESVAVGDVGKTTARVVVDRQGGAWTVTADVLPGGDQLIVVSTKLAVSTDNPGTVLLSTMDGELVRLRPGERDDDELVRQAASAAADGTSGYVVGAAGQGTIPIVAYAPVTTGAAKTKLGVSVLLAGSVPAVENTRLEGVLVPTVTLLGVMLLVLLLLGGALIRPVRQLRANALAIASGRLDTPVGTYRISEMNRIATALERCRRTLAGESPAAPPRRRRFSARTAVVLATVVVLVWSGAVMLTLGRQEVQVPKQAVQITQSLANTTAAAVQGSLQQGVTDLKAFATRIVSADSAQLRPALAELAFRHPRYRSVYVVDLSGNVEARAGRAPLRQDGRPPREHGLHQQNTVGRVPVVYASAPLAGGRHVLIGELDVVKLSAVVRKPGGVGRLVDAGLRTVAATVGFRAHEKITAEPLSRNVSNALRGEPEPTVEQVDGRMSVIASAPIRGSRLTSELQWAIVIQQPVSELPLPGNDIRRNAWLASLVAAVAALGLLGWHLLVLVLPLRRVAANADRLAEGDISTVIYPQRPDEIGTIARCLELCRQAIDKKGS